MLENVRDSKLNKRSKLSLYQLTIYRAKLYFQRKGFTFKNRSNRLLSIKKTVSPHTQTSGPIFSMTDHFLQSSHISHSKLFDHKITGQNIKACELCNKILYLPLGKFRLIKGSNVYVCVWSACIPVWSCMCVRTILWFHSYILFILNTIEECNSRTYSVHVTKFRENRIVQSKIE